MVCLHMQPFLGKATLTWRSLLQLAYLWLSFEVADNSKRRKAWYASTNIPANQRLPVVLPVDSMVSKRILRRWDSYILETS